MTEVEPQKEAPPPASRKRPRSRSPSPQSRVIRGAVLFVVRDFEDQPVEQARHGAAWNGIVKHPPHIISAHGSAEAAQAAAEEHLAKWRDNSDLKRLQICPAKNTGGFVSDSYPYPGSSVHANVESVRLAAGSAAAPPTDLPKRVYCITTSCGWFGAEEWIPQVKVTAAYASLADAREQLLTRAAPDAKVNVVQEGGFLDASKGEDFEAGKPILEISEPVHGTWYGPRGQYTPKPTLKAVVAVDVM